MLAVPGAGSIRHSVARLLVFIFGKLVTYLLLPPGGLIAVLLAAGVASLIAGRAKRLRLAVTATSIALASSVLLYLVSIRPVADLLLAPLERDAALAAAESAPGTAPEAAPPAAGLIVVLGGGTVPARHAGAPVLSRSSVARAAEAVALRNRTGLPVLLSGGDPLSRHGESEAETARDLLIRLGVDPPSIIIETASRNTWENAAFTAEATDIRVVYLVTSALHMPRSIECFVAHGFTVFPVPSDFRAYDSRYTAWDFLPSSGSLDDAFAAIHEYVGIVSYRLIYGRSRNRNKGQKASVFDVSANISRYERSQEFLF